MTPNLSSKIVDSHLLIFLCVVSWCPFIYLSFRKNVTPLSQSSEDTFGVSYPICNNSFSLEVVFHLWRTLRSFLEIMLIKSNPFFLVKTFSGSSMDLWFKRNQLDHPRELELGARDRLWGWKNRGILTCYKEPFMGIKQYRKPANEGGKRSINKSSILENFLGHGSCFLLITCYAPIYSFSNSFTRYVLNIHQHQMLCYAFFIFYLTEFYLGV